MLPQRVEFYENWINSHGLREGAMGLAPLMAVISFLRTEGRAYEPLVARAGEYAADWSVQAMSPFTHRLFLALPQWLRTRAALSVARAVIRDSYSGSRATTRVRKGVVTVDLRGSLFCTVRTTAEGPLCGFYGSVIERVLKLFQVPAVAVPVKCRATGEPGCEIHLTLQRKSAPDPARAD